MLEFLGNLWLLAGLVVLLFGVLWVFCSMWKFYSENLLLYLFCGGQEALEAVLTVAYYVLVAMFEVLKALCGSKE